ncbi:MAG TPA: STAS domain-containing protein [Pseudonocardia sp.]|uniref:STAS domain-containing protein n=1 Tax=Pseudonocardia sp. TaxID=60912 RepID=UPI002C183DAF|nr:STAS domain-containing protein [Pseudonocardia sp.]HTF55352.1 STAS domain-containing protein [Pseudonocardia sp.]
MPSPVEQLISTEVELPAPGTALVRVLGEVDILTSPTLGDAIAEGFAHDPRRLIIDLDKVEFLGTGGIAVLLAARTTARERGIELRLVSSRSRARRPLELAGILELFTLSPSTEHALAELPGLRTNPPA